LKKLSGMELKDIAIDRTTSKEALARIYREIKYQIQQTFPASDWLII
jgi:hypothetical protein